MLLITGAGGKTGRTLIKTLSKVESIYAFVHREEHVSIAKSLGAEKATVSDMLDVDEVAIRAAMQEARADPFPPYILQLKVFCLKCSKDQTDLTRISCTSTA